jgi:hypothetical protein
MASWDLHRRCFGAHRLVGLGAAQSSEDSGRSAMTLRDSCVRRHSGTLAQPSVRSRGAPSPDLEFLAVSHLQHFTLEDLD